MASACPHGWSRYCKVKVGEGGPEKCTAVIANNLDPVWNEELAFNNVAPDATISLQCWDQVRFSIAGECFRTQSSI
jgi:hypothetical protein